MNLRGAHYRYCNGSAFYIREGELIEVRIDCRIIIDAAYFQKINLNYFRPTVVIDRDYGYDLSPFLKLS